LRIRDLKKPATLVHDPTMSKLLKVFPIRFQFRWTSLCQVLAIAFFLAACSSDSALTSLPADSVILAFGDSLTYGTGAGAGESYPAVLERIIGRRVVNSGVPGEVTRAGLARLAEALDREKPALLILCHGGNDLLRRLSREETAGNLRAMIRMARERRAGVVLIAVPAPGFSLSPSSIYGEIAREMSVPLDDSTLSAILSDGALKSDTIHPNAAGYRRMAEAVSALLKKHGAL
jgi:lysophospholipase L1-like esterase